MFVVLFNSKSVRFQYKFLFSKSGQSKYSDIGGDSVAP